MSQSLFGTGLSSRPERNRGIAPEIVQGANARMALVTRGVLAASRALAKSKKTVNAAMPQVEKAFQPVYTVNHQQVAAQAGHAVIGVGQQESVGPAPLSPNEKYVNYIAGKPANKLVMPQQRTAESEREQAALALVYAAHDGTMRPTEKVANPPFVQPQAPPLTHADVELAA